MHQRSPARGSAPARPHALPPALRGASHALALPVALPVCAQRVVSCAVIQMRRPIFSSRIVCATQRSVGKLPIRFSNPRKSCPYGQSSPRKSRKRRRHGCVAVALRSVASPMPVRRAKPSARICQWERWRSTECRGYLVGASPMRRQQGAKGDQRRIGALLRDCCCGAHVRSSG